MSMSAFSQNDPLDFSGKSVLVVGGSSGIGNGIAHQFRAHGAIVHVCGRRANAADYAGEAGSNLDGLIYSQLDVADAGAIDRWEAPFSTLDVLVCSQGIAIYKRQEFTMQGFRNVLDVNLLSVMALCTKLHSLLAASHGSAILVGSAAGAEKATIGNPGYSASKGGLRILTKTLAAAWGPDGIRVNNLAPGLVETRITRVTRDHPRRYEESLKKIPLGRWGTPEEIGGIALFLASPLAAYITGQTLIADGGKILL